MKIKVEVEGLEAIVDKIDDLVDEQDLIMAMGKACAVVERAAKEKAPKGTGELRRSITSRVDAKNGSVEGIIFTPLEYAPYVEFGTGLFAEGGNGRKDVPWFIPISNEFPLSKAEKYHMRIFEGSNGQKFAMSFGQDPHPFMRPAINENRTKILRILKEGLGID
jgi:HK97 gp10 family phage protein